MTEDSPDSPIVLPIDGTLDLHAFRPTEIKALIPDYIAACRQKGILQLRIIHGKGTGTLMRTVHGLLCSHPDVIAFQLADETGGGWGATLVTLHPAEKAPGHS